MRLCYTMRVGQAGFKDCFTRWRRGAAFFPRLVTRRELAVVLGLFSACSVSIFASVESATASNTTNLSERSYLGQEYGLGNWIWAAKTHDQQTCRFWRRIDIPTDATVVEARLTVTADDAYRLYFDGRDIGQGNRWEHLTQYDLTQILAPGAHILAVECYNEYLRAGLVAGLRIKMQDGRSIEVKTDAGWKIVPNEDNKWITRRSADPQWPAAVIEAKFGDWTGGQALHIFHIAPIQPIVVTIWQTTWFRTLIFSICGTLTALCLWLLGKVAVYSQAQQVVRRERARIARDIHDDLTAGLTQLVLFGEVAQSELAEGSEAHRQVGKVCEKARSLSGAMNEIIWMVNSQRDTFRDFTSYLCKYAEMFLEATAIRCRFDVVEEMPDLPCDLGVRRNLFLGVKEALNNVVRHSGASEVLLQIRWRDQQMVVAIEDNGHGFDPALAERQRNGLSNMMARAAEAGGVCRIISQPGAGCRVEYAVSRARASGQHLRFWKRAPSTTIPMPPAHSTQPADVAEAGAAGGTMASSPVTDVAAPGDTPAWRKPLS
jgi:two-component sensor histidine kinase